MKYMCVANSSAYTSRSLGVLARAALRSARPGGKRKKIEGFQCARFSFGVAKGDLPHISWIEERSRSVNIAIPSKPASESVAKLMLVKLMLYAAARFWRTGRTYESVMAADTSSWPAFELHRRMKEDPSDPVVKAAALAKKIAHAREMAREWCKREAAAARRREKWDREAQRLTRLAERRASAFVKSGQLKLELKDLAEAAEAFEL